MPARPLPIAPVTTRDAPACIEGGARGPDERGQGQDLVSARRPVRQIRDLAGRPRRVRARRQRRDGNLDQLSRHKIVADRGMSEKAQATAKRIEQSMSELERQISWVTRAAPSTLEERRADYAQLLNQVPQVSQLFQINGRAARCCGCRARPPRSAATRISPAISASPKRWPAAPASPAPISAADGPFMSISRGAFRLQRRRHGGRDRPRLPLRLPRRRPGRQGNVRLCRRPARQGAGGVRQGARDRQGPLAADAGRGRPRAGRHPSPPAPMPTAMRC